MGTSADGLETVAERVRYARELASLSQRQLSKAAGLSHSTIYFIETENRKGLRLTTVQAIARTLDVSPEWLLLGTGSPPKA